MKLVKIQIECTIPDDMDPAYAASEIDTLLDAGQTKLADDADEFENDPDIEDTWSMVNFDYGVASVVSVLENQPNCNSEPVYLPKTGDEI